jgi:hypothetical protein
VGSTSIYFALVTCANSSTGYIDPNLIAFLKMYFPDEVKAKQKLNERMALVDEFGQQYVDARCSVM